MLTAEEAKERTFNIRENRVERKIGEIDELILAAIREGSDSISVLINLPTDNQTKLIKLIEKLGYQVENSGQQYYISWR